VVSAAARAVGSAFGGEGRGDGDGDVVVESMEVGPRAAALVRPRFSRS
jgi:hypothetical protein